MHLCESATILAILFRVVLTQQPIPNCNDTDFYMANLRNLSQNCEGQLILDVNNETISQSIKNSILDLHNKTRTNAENGIPQLHFDHLPPLGQKLRQLEWDDDLALKAQAWANRCERVPFRCNGDVFPQSSQTLLSNDPKSLKETLNFIMRAWVSKRRFVETSTAFSQIISPDTIAVGCGIVRTRINRGRNLYYRTDIVCFYKNNRNSITL